jgi:YesN/AraC family two-component response regulator
MQTKTGTKGTSKHADCQTEVAEMVGYPNPYYFSKLYKKYFASETESAPENR